MNINDLPKHEVIIARATVRGEKIYHTTNCDRHPSKPRTMDRAMADAWEFSECKYCQDNRAESEVTADD